MTCHVIGTVRLYEVSGQCNTEAALLQLKKPDDKLVPLSTTIFRTYLPLFSGIFRTHLPLFSAIFRTCLSLIRCSLSACLRSRCCFILHDVVSNRLFVWKGVKASNILRQTAVTAAQKLNER